MFFRTDAMGSVRTVTSAQGAVLHRYDYSPDGALLHETGTGVPWNRRSWAGKERDVETASGATAALAYSPGVVRRGATVRELRQAGGDLLEGLKQWAEWREALVATGLYCLFLYLILMLPLALVLLWKEWPSGIPLLGGMCGLVIAASYPVLVVGYRLRKWFDSPREK